MSRATESLREVDAEIEDRARRLRMLKDEYSRKNGRDTVPEAVTAAAMDAKPDPKAQRGKATPKEQELLDAVAKQGYKPGDTVNVPDFADALGVTRGRASQLASYLKCKGLWQYTSAGAYFPPKPQLDRETFPALRARINGETPKAQPQAERQPAAQRPTPPTPDRRAADPELELIQSILDQLGRLPSDSARSRVLAYLASRKEELI